MTSEQQLAEYRQMEARAIEHARQLDVLGRQKIKQELLDWLDANKAGLGTHYEEYKKVVEKLP